MPYPYDPISELFRQSIAQQTGPQPSAAPPVPQFEAAPMPSAPMPMEAPPPGIVNPQIQMPGSFPMPPGNAAPPPIGRFGQIAGMISGQQPQPGKLNPILQLAQALAPIVGGLVGGPEVGYGMVQGQQQQQQQRMRQAQLQAQIEQDRAEREARLRQIQIQEDMAKAQQARFKMEDADKEEALVTRSAEQAWGNFEQRLKDVQIQPDQAGPFMRMIASNYPALSKKPELINSLVKSATLAANTGQRPDVWIGPVGERGLPPRTQEDVQYYLQNGYIPYPPWMASEADKEATRRADVHKQTLAETRANQVRETDEMMLDGKHVTVTKDRLGNIYDLQNNKLDPNRLKPYVKPTGSPYLGSQDDPEDIAQGIINGDLPPTMRGMYRIAGPVQAILSRKKFPLAQMQTEWGGVQRWMASANSTQQLRMRQAVEKIGPHVDVIEDLYNQLKQKGLPSGFRMWNKAALTVAASMPGETGALAQNLQTQIVDLSAELGNVYMGGNTPTDHALQQAAQNLKAEWNPETFKMATDLIRKNVVLRRNAIKWTGPGGVPIESPYYPQQTIAPDQQPATPAVPPAPKKGDPLGIR